MKAQPLAIFGLSIALGFGCSGGGDEWTEKLPETVEATGVVTLDGQPVDGATVIFAPTAGTHAAQALTDAGGKFSANAFPSKPGMVPGSYMVAISKTVEKKGRPVTGPDAAHMPPGGNVTWVNVLPENYFNPNASGLKAEIPQDGTTSLKFELKK